MLRCRMRSRENLDNSNLKMISENWKIFDLEFIENLNRK